VADTDNNELIPDEDNPLLTDFDDEEVNVKAVDDRKSFEASLAAGNRWGLSAKGLEATKAAHAMIATKTGMFARIPIICKADECPYADSCQLLPYDLAPEGEFCPVEIAQVENRTMSYAEDIGIENASFTDKVLLNEIVGLDIMLERCRALMAKEGTPVIEIVAGVSEHGDEIKQPTVSKAWDAYERISKKRDAAFSMLMMTRKDNKDRQVADDSNMALSDILANTLNAEDYKEE
jgi:hypothetical protein